MVLLHHHGHWFTHQNGGLIRHFVPHLWNVLHIRPRRARGHVRKHQSLGNCVCIRFPRINRGGATAARSGFARGFPIRMACFTCRGDNLEGFRFACRAETRLPDCVTGVVITFNTDLGVCIGEVFVKFKFTCFSFESQRHRPPTQNMLVLPRLLNKDAELLGKRSASDPALETSRHTARTTAAHSNCGDDKREPIAKDCRGGAAHVARATTVLAHARGQEIGLEPKWLRNLFISYYYHMENTNSSIWVFLPRILVVH